MNKLILNENVTMSSMDIKLKDIGHVYFLLDKDRSLVKIGKSKKPEQRVASLITLLGIKSFDYFISKKIVNYSTIETLLHQEFKGGEF